MDDGRWNTRYRLSSIVYRLAHAGCFTNLLLRCLPVRLQRRRDLFAMPAIVVGQGGDALRDGERAASRVNTGPDELGWPQHAQELDILGALLGQCDQQE